MKPKKTVEGEEPSTKCKLQLSLLAGTWIYQKLDHPDHDQNLVVGSTWGSKNPVL